MQWDEVDTVGGGNGSCCDLVVSNFQLTHTHPPSTFPTLHPVTHSTGMMPYHQNLVQLSQLVSSSEQMLSVISEPIPLQGNYDSLVRTNINKIELIMDDRTLKQPCKVGAH